MKPVILLLSSALAFSATAGDVYMSRDANGNVVFSDQPSVNAQRHQVKELPTLPAFVPPPAEHKPAQVQESSFSYTSLSIVSPPDGHSLARGFAGNLDISGVLSPGLRETDTIVLIDNGTVIREGRQTSFQLTNLNRGEHQLQMAVRDQNNESLISSNTVTLHVQRASVLNRGN